MRFQHFLILYTKINPKLFKDLNVRPEIIKFLDKNRDRTLCNTNYSKIDF